MTSPATQSRPASSVPPTTPGPPVPLPTTSPGALTFLQNINPLKDFKYLMFTDSLVTVSDMGKELGVFIVSIEPVKFKGNPDCFLVHANSHGAVDGVPCGTSITTYVDRSLATLDQQHHEYVKLENCPLDRKTSVVRQEDFSFTVSRTIKQGEDIQKINKTFQAEDMKGFISEGSNLLLLRLLIDKKTFSDDFQLISFDSELNLSPVIYKRLEERIQTVEETELSVFGIERTINSVQDLPTSWQSYFLSDGHLANRVQVGSPVTMKLIKVPMLIEREEEPPKPAFDKKSLIWEDDLQLYSTYLDRKEELKGDHSVYLRHHPELKALLADFLQFLLLRKPEDVIAFSTEYFAAFSSTIPSVPSYLQSDASSPFPFSHSNENIDKLRTPLL